MSYRCGIGGGMARLGYTPGPAHVTCDSCGVVKFAETKRGDVPMWILKRKAPPGWRMVRHDDGTREDYCPACKEKTR